jgi:hypothetical protein
MYKAKFNITLLIAFMISLLCFTHVDAQASTATLSGVVIDANGAAVPGATVILSNSATGFERKIVTGEQGAFTIPLLPPSNYTLTVNREGFAPSEIKNVTLNVGDQKSLQVQLKVGQVGAVLEVNAEPSLINASPAVSTTIDRRFVESIPLNGRTFQSLILLTPGVVLGRANFSDQGQMSINGQRTNSNYFSVDGVSANFGINAGGGAGQAGGGELPALNVSGGFQNLVSVDALQEFTIQTSTYAPEFGRQPGGQISIATRSGTNSLRGTLFEYLRNDRLDANDWFANRNKLAKPKERQNDFGFVVGGPVIIPAFGEGGSPIAYDGRDRTFFFLSYEGLRLRQPLVATTQVPSLALRQNTAISPAVRAILNSFPIPNGGDAGNNLAFFSASFSEPTTLDATSIRIDHDLTGKLRIFGRYNNSPSTKITRSGRNELNNPVPTVFDTQTVTLGADWSLSNTVANELRANWSRLDGVTYSLIDDFGGAVPLTDSVLPPLPSNIPISDAAWGVNLFGLINTGFGRNGEGIQHQLNFVDNLSILRGSHQMRFGADYRYLTPTALSRAADFTYRFQTVTDLINSTLTIQATRRASPINYAFANFSAYGQDTWSLNRRLTLTYGLRWDVNPAPKGRKGTALYPANQTDNVSTLVFGDPNKPMWSTTWNNFAPRVGAAYKVRQSGSTVVRGGFGVFYDLPDGTISNFASGSPYVLAGPALPYQYPPSSVTIPVLSLNPPFGFTTFSDAHLKQPYTLQWNVGLEQAIGASSAVIVSYVGAAGRRLLRQDLYFSPNPTFSILTITRNRAQSDYDAMQVSYQRRLSHGFQALASWTWSHSIDTASSDAAILPPASNIDVNQDRGPSDFDVRHSVSGAAVWDLPTPHAPGALKAVLGRWTLDGIFIARTAFPVNVTISRNLGFGTFAFRPDLVAGVPFYLDDPNQGGGRRINNTTISPLQSGPFLVSTDLRQGTLGRNALRGFPANQINLAVGRRFNFTEHLDLRLRAEFFNIFNHPNFADPSGSLGSLSSSGVFSRSGSFGTSPSMLNTSLGAGGQSGGLNSLYQFGGPRSIQLSLKIGF